MPGTRADEYQTDDGERTTQYQIAVPTEQWEAWKATIPRTKPLYQRIQELLQVDTALDGEVNPETVRLLLFKADRLQERTRTARHALARGDEETVREELAGIDELIEQLRS